MVQKLLALRMITDRKFLTILSILEVEIRSRTDENQPITDENSPILLQLHNRSINSIDTCNFRFFRLLDAIVPACKEYN